MKKNLIAITGVLIITGIVLFANAKIISGQLNKITTTKNINIAEQKSIEKIPITIKENNSLDKQIIFPDSVPSEEEITVPDLKFEPEIKKTSSIEEYLAKSISQEEIETYYYWADNCPNPASLSNRKMTEDESNRRIVLEDKYVYDEIKPKNPLPLVPGDYDVYYDIKNDTFHYPERELTDEELLQLVDQGFRLNYALSTRITNIIEKPSSLNIKQEVAFEKSTKIIKNLFGADVSSLETNISFTKFSPDSPENWIITFRPYKYKTLMVNKKTFWSYVIFINALSGDLIDVTASCSTFERTPITNEAMDNILNDESWIEKAKSILINDMGETRKIKDAFVDTEHNKGEIDDVRDGISFSNAKRGIVNIIVKLEDNSTYTVELYNPDQILRCVTYEKAN